MIYRRAISMAETTVATLLLGIVLASTMQIVGPTVRHTNLMADRIVAFNLANELTEEISLCHFQDPDEETGDTIGVDTDERPAQRGDFDDVDDYSGWTSSPPKLSSNQSNLFLDGWTRSAKVTHVLVSDPSVESATETGLKRIIVVVSKNGIEHARVVSYQSKSADTFGFGVSQVIGSGG